MRTHQRRAYALILAAIATLLAPSAQAQVKLIVKEAPLKIKGREVPMMAIVQENGKPGYSPDQAGGFDVEVVNKLNVPTSIHWHGLILPNLMDGVPYVTQEPIAPGATMKYKFPLKQSGSYWMHSHYGLQEQYLNSAPMIIWTPAEKALADVQHVVMLTDFSFTPPAEILKGLIAGSAMPPMPGMEKGPMASMPGVMEGMGMGKKPMEMKEKKPSKPKQPMAMQMPKGKEQTVYAQELKDGKFVRVEKKGTAADIDIKYDALLANRTTINQPEHLGVKAGQTVLLRLIASSSATDFFIDTGALEAELLAVDGQAIEPKRGHYFQLAVAQRIDLRVKIPAEGGAFPIVAQGEGTTLQCGMVLATAGAKIPDLPENAKYPTASLDNTQERELRATAPLAPKEPTKTFPVVLDGNMATYVWTINGAAYPNRNSLDVKEGERVAITFENRNSMGHPMHLHGHTFQIVELDGTKLSGAMRDTIEVPPGSKVTIAFDANNPGVWAFHCHILYHLARGMFTVLKYDGADTQFWQPEKSATESAQY